jgi:hypothetical protein
VARSVRPEGEAFFCIGIRPRAGTLELEIDDLERRTIERSLAERRSHLIETTEDTTRTPARRQAGLRELSTIASVLRKLRLRST